MGPVSRIWFINTVMVNSILLTPMAAQIRDHESPLDKMWVLTLKSQSTYGRGSLFHTRVSLMMVIAAS